MKDFSLSGKCPVCRCSWAVDESEVHSPLCAVVKDLKTRVEKLEGERPSRWSSCGNNFEGMYCLKTRGHSGLHGNDGGEWS